MSYHTYMWGEITIEPPIAWHLLKDSKYLPENTNEHWTDLCFRVETETVETDRGPLTVIQAVAIHSENEERRGDKAEAELADILQQFGEGRTFTGRIDAEGEENKDMWRLKVVDGKAAKFAPQIIWPEASN
jgi:hypothetical protein